MDSLLRILRCPLCHRGLRFEARPTPREGRAPFGILSCGSHRFPLLDGIPILTSAPVGMFEHTRGTAQVEGVTVDELIRLVDRGDCLEALLECLAVPRLPRLAATLLGWRLSHGTAGTRAARALGRRNFRAQVLAHRDGLSARELFAFYYPPGGPLDPELGHYFALRFAQPRHLAALALASTVPSSERPVLDIACGTGHLDHYLTQRTDACGVVGLDMNFYHLWIARHWFAPAASFVCANVSDGLPFVDDSFSATFCSDAFHYFPHRRQLLAEIRRCAPSRQIVLTRVGNAAVKPNEGQEESLHGYLRELAPDEPYVFEESRLVKSYLRRNDPLQASQSCREDLEDGKWLSFVCNAPKIERPRVDWPHAVGRLALNPVYAIRPGADGGVRLNFKFPSIDYTYENHGMLAYHAPSVALTAAQVAAVRSGTRNPELAPLIDSFALLGVPHRFDGEPLALGPTDPLKMERGRPRSTS